MRSKTVLCVDDEKIGLRVRKIMLESRGYAVLTANNGPEGLKVFDENHVDLVVLDYFMPDLNGGEVASEMRRRRPGRSHRFSFRVLFSSSRSAASWLTRSSPRATRPTC